MKLGFVFPGQGSQFVGMGKDYYEKYECVRKVYNKASQILGFDIAKLSFEGPEEELNQTKNTQLAILVMSLAISELLKQNNIDNITLVTKDNINNYQKILNILKEGTYSKELVGEAIESYNKKYNTNISLEDFTKNISGYASQKIKENVNYDEVIAEAIHDYYLHRDSSSTSSLEIINILKERLQQ